MNPICIRLATTADLPAIGRIQAASPQASQWPPQDYLAYRCTVAEREDGTVGFLVSRETAPGEREILNLAVDPPARRKGVALALLDYELQHSRGQWFLELRAYNEKAIRLYESLGFQRVGVRNNYYSSPPESAIVMRIFS